MGKNRKRNKNKIKCEKRKGSRWMSCKELRQLLDLDNLELLRNENINEQRTNNSNF
jgi:hypothetical protein